MLAIFFTVNFFLFAAMVGGSVLAYSGEDNIKNTFDMALEAYNDQPEDKNLKEYKKVWNEVQNEVQSCKQGEGSLKRFSTKMTRTI